MPDDIDIIKNMLELSQTDCYNDINGLLDDASNLKSSNFSLTHYSKSNWRHVAKKADQSRKDIDTKQSLAICMLIRDLKKRFKHINEKGTFDLVIDLIKDQSYELNKNFYQALSKIKEKLVNLYKGYLSYSH